jgi:hypothetical protein
MAKAKPIETETTEHLTFMVETLLPWERKNSARQTRTLRRIDREMAECRAELARRSA